MSERDELAELLSSDRLYYDTGSHYELSADDAADMILAAGYRKPRTITTAEELDALPVGSVVLSEKYIHHANGMQISFQRWDDWLWHRGARSSDTHPDYFLPATVLWEPK